MSEINKNSKRITTLADKEKKTYIKLKRIQLNFAVRFGKWRNLPDIAVQSQALCKHICPLTTVYFLLCQAGPFWCLWHSRSTDTPNLAMSQMIR